MGRDAGTRTARRGLALGSLAMAALLGLGGFGCASPPPVPEPVETGQLVLWEATAPGGDRVHLLGTLHVGRTHTEFDPAIRAALSESDVLALELRMTDLEPATIQATFARVGLLSAETIFDVVAPKTEKLLRRWLAATGTDEMAVASLEPWAVWLMVVSQSVSSAGFSFDNSIENELTRREAPTLPVVGLETLDDQFAALDALPRDVQEDMLRGSLEGALAPASATPPGNAPPEAREETQLAEVTGLMVDAWRRGDLDWIEGLALGAESQDFSYLLIEARNETMADGIEQLVAEGRRPFVAVGVAHMVGAQGLPTLLAERGYRVRRIPKTKTGAAPEE